MLSRIRKKLYLSAKVTDGMRDIYANTDEGNDSSKSTTTLASGDLLQLLKAGMGAVVKWDEDEYRSTFESWRNTPIEDIIQKSRATMSLRDTKEGIQNTDQAEKNGEINTKTMQEIEEEERALLAGMERVHCRLFEGVNHANKSNKESADGEHVHTWLTHLFTHICLRVDTQRKACAR